MRLCAREIKAATLPFFLKRVPFFLPKKGIFGKKLPKEGVSRIDLFQKVPLEGVFQINFCQKIPFTGHLAGYL